MSIAQFDYMTLTDDIAETANVAHELWVMLIQLQEQEAMRNIDTFILSLQRLMNRQQELITAGISTETWNALLGKFPALLQAMECKDYLALADILEYEVRPLLDSLTVFLTKKQRVVNKNNKR